VKMPVSEAARQLEERGLLKRERQDHSERVIEHVGNLLGRELPPDLASFYRERIARLGDATPTHAESIAQDVVALVRKAVSEG